MPYAELKFFQHAAASQHSFHGKVENQLDGSKNKSLYNTFKERLDDVNTLRVLANTIKQFIKRNKSALLKKQRIDLPTIKTI